MMQGLQLRKWPSAAYAKLGELLRVRQPATSSKMAKRPALEMAAPSEKRSRAVVAGLHFVQLPEAEGVAIADDVRAFLAVARTEHLVEHFTGTSSQRTIMYQFRDDDLPRALLDCEQRSADASTALGGRGPPPACVDRLLAGLYAARPELKRHYRVGWVQINDSSGSDAIRAHVDRPGWGDVICTFTTAEFALVLKSDGRGRVCAANRAGTFEVPANSLYVLSGASRTSATHAVAFKVPRASVVLRFYLRDLLSLGVARSPPRLVKGDIVTARYPMNQGEAEIHPDYRSVYPARVEDVNGDKATLAFFASAVEGPAAAPVITPLALVCGRSTGWHLDDHAILGVRYRAPR